MNIANLFFTVHGLCYSCKNTCSEQKFLLATDELYEGGSADGKENRRGDHAESAPETHTRRQASQHGCLPSLLYDGNKGKSVRGGKKYFVFALTRAAKAEQKFLVPARQAQRTNQD